MRNFAVYSALLSCSAGLFLITSWILSPGLGNSLIVPFAGLMFLALVFPLFVGAMALGRVEMLTERLAGMEQKLRILSAQVPPPSVHSTRSGMPPLSKITVKNRLQAPLA
jgi:hypothetical protein